MFPIHAQSDLSAIDKHSAVFHKFAKLDAYNYEHLYKKVLNKINELVDAVNKLNGVHDNEC